MLLKREKQSSRKRIVAKLVGVEVGVAVGLELGAAVGSELGLVVGVEVGVAEKKKKKMGILGMKSIAQQNLLVFFCNLTCWSCSWRCSWLNCW